MYVTSRGIVYYSSQEYIIAATLSGSVVYQANRTYKPGYIVTSTGSMLQDKEGNLVLSRIARTNGGLDKHVYIDRLSSTGVLETLFSTEQLGDPNVADNFSLSAAGEIPGFGLAEGALYASVCSTQCNLGQAAVKLYKVADATQSFEYPRSALFTKFWQDNGKPVNYVALGDSFSSGEGVPPFIAGTDDAYNTCHRSTSAYSVLLDKDLSINLQSFRACSGATTESLVSGQHTNGNQLDAIGGETDAITLTIGGNDIGFANFAGDCVFGDCSEVTDTFRTTLSKITDELPGKLDGLLEKIQAKLPSGAKARVLVIGYPRIMPYDDGTWLNCSYLSPEEQVAIRRVTTGLNSAIATAVQGRGYPFEFVDADLILDSVRVSPFAGHELCSAEGYFNGASLPKIYSFHPNTQGHQAYADLIKRYLMSPNA